MGRFNYVAVQNKHDESDAIKLLDEPFSGIIIQYGKVTFEVDEENDSLKIGFEYEILDQAGKEFTDKKPFERYLGDLLQELIHQGIEENNITYTGGVDENRDSDSVKLDSQ